ncbi:MAG: prolyl oligopeptidase family serine peptidase [Clostridia bacterium]|nr:prolyl oligopeptidase family serine peptidase [Clostridia bacterium]
MNITDWNGYEKINFSVNGRDGFIVCPKTPLEGNPWVWRAEFFDAFNYVDVELLKKGWFLAYYSVSDMYGCPASIEMMKEFYSVATGEYKLSKKPAIFGFSRGGLYATNFALTYPEYCGLLYLDAPVLDIRSWPAGFGTGCGDPESWEQCKKLYSLTDETAKDYKMNPLDRTEELAKTNIPVFLVCGASDSVVPYSENGLPFFEKMKKSSATIEQIVKPNCEHHPHSLSEPKPIVDFIEKMYGAGKP